MAPRKSTTGSGPRKPPPRVAKPKPALGRAAPATERLHGWLLHGDFDSLVRERSSLLREVRARRDRQAPADPETLRLKAIAAQAHLLAGEKNSAAECLFPYLHVEQGQLRVLEDPRDKLHKLPQRQVAAQISTQVSATLYGHLKFGPALTYAEHAMSLLGRDREDAPSEHRGLGDLVRAEAQMWKARALLRCKRHSDARDSLKTALGEITDAYLTQRGHRSGLAVPMAQCLSIMGSTLWATGEHDLARRRIYRAVLVHYMSDGTRDSLRRSYGYHLAAKYESSESAQGFKWAIALAEIAEAGLTAAVRDCALDHHPWKTLATIQKGQTLVKAATASSDSATAATLLAEARTALQRASEDIPLIRRSDTEEADRAHAELLLAQLWILEDEADRQPTMNRWQRCAYLAADMLAIAALPPRLKAEAHLHSGRALAHLDGHRDEGRKELETALEIAASDERRKIEAGAHLALAESYRGTSPELFAKHLESARGLLQRNDTESTFLRRLEKKLQPAALAEIGEITLAMEHMKFSDFIKAAEDAYARYHGEKSHWTFSSFSQKTAVNRNKFFKWKRDLAKRALVGD